jgi:hypothetical protein
MKVRAGRIFAIRLKNHTLSRASVGCWMGGAESLVGRAWRRALYTHSSPFDVGDGRTVADNQVEGEPWCRLDHVEVAWLRALETRSSLL